MRIVSFCGTNVTDNVVMRTLAYLLQADIREYCHHEGFPLQIEEEDEKSDCVIVVEDFYLWLEEGFVHRFFDEVIKLFPQTPILWLRDSIEHPTNVMPVSPNVVYFDVLEFCDNHSIIDLVVQEIQKLLAGGSEYPLKVIQ